MPGEAELLSQGKCPVPQCLVFFACGWYVEIRVFFVICLKLAIKRLHLTLKPGLFLTLSEGIECFASALLYFNVLAVGE